MSPIVIYLDSRDCYALEGTEQEYPRRLKGDRLRYAIEDSLSCDAEAIAIARGKVRGGRVLMLVAEVERVRQRMVEQISARYPAGEVPDGLCIHAITPTLTLAIDELAREKRLRGMRGLVWVHDNGTADVVELVDSSMIRWRWCSSDLASISEALREYDHDSLVDGSKDARVLWIDESAGIEKPEGFSGVLEEFPIGGTPGGSESATLLSTLAERYALRIMESRNTATWDLREGPLAAARDGLGALRPVNAAVWISLLLLATVVGILHLRTRGQHAIAASQRQRQATAFERVFDQQPVPVGIATRLGSELQRLRGTRGAEAVEIRPRSVAWTLRRVLRGLPDSDVVRYQVSAMSLSPEGIKSLGGEALSVEDHQRFVDAMAAAGFEIPPVSAVRTRQGVAIELSNITVGESGARGNGS